MRARVINSVRGMESNECYPGIGEIPWLLHKWAIQDGLLFHKESQGTPYGRLDRRNPWVFTRKRDGDGMQQDNITER